MGIPMWREPSKAEASKSALEKDSSAAARSSIRRVPTLRHTGSRARRSNVLSSFHSQILDELRRGAGEPRRVPRFSFIPASGPSGANDNGLGDGMTYDQAEREAASRATSRASGPGQIDTAQRRNRTSRDRRLTDLLNRFEGNEPRVVYATPSLTPNFAPAFGHSSATYSVPSEGGVRLPPMRERESRDDPPANALFPPEIRPRRSSHAHTQPAGDPIMDGLGDRQRSPSPDGDRDIDAWHTLLLTMTPDATFPSTDTSFASTSASASATDTLSNTLPRSPVPLTTHVGPARAHVGLDPYSDSINPCDLSSDDEEDGLFRYSDLMGGASSMRPSQRRFHGQPSTMSRHPPVPTVAVSLSDHHQNDELQHMQVILDRLARRGDIPDDWWAAAGLARTLDRGLNASMDSTDTEGARTTRRDH